MHFKVHRNAVLLLHARESAWESTTQRIQANSKHLIFIDFGITAQHMELFFCVCLATINIPNALYRNAIKSVLLTYISSTILFNSGLFVEWDRIIHHSQS